MASGIHSFALVRTGWPVIDRQENDQMSKTVTIALPAQTSLFRRLLAVIDRVLMANARIAIRNGDLPHFGL